MGENYVADQSNDYESMSKITNAGFCQKARAFTYKMSTPEKPENYTRSAVIKDTVKAALWYEERDPKNIMEYMASRFDECAFQNYQQKRINLLWDHRRVMRYLESETRKPVFPKGKIIMLANHKFLVAPDFCFVQGTDTIEVVSLKIGKANVTKRGKRNAEIRDLTLYAMILFGRQLGFTKITASLYFLKKESDTQNWMECEQSFFGGGGNVVSMTDLYTGERNDTDIKMERSLNILEQGLPEVRMCEQDCEYCEKRDLCKYLLPPVRLLKEPIVRNVSDITLTASQKKAISFNKGIARINAGAGAGKTMVVAFHIKYLIEHGVRPEEICCITFTNAGAKEMLHRAELYTGRELPDMTICTFNSFENDVVKDCWKMLGFAREPKVIDDVERYGIIAELLNKNPIYEWTGNSFLNFTGIGSWQKGALQIVADVFSAIKRKNMPLAQITPDLVQYAVNGTDMNDAALYKVIQLYDQYDQELKHRGLIEFDDQEILTFKVLAMDPQYLARNYCFKHIVVDEFQDSSEGQIDLIKQFRMMPTFESLMVIGDDSQAIFGFRNTTPEYIINFEKYIGEKVEDIYLVENHRSTPEIIQFANRINEMNLNRVHKNLVATRPAGAKVMVNGFYNTTDEYRFIVTGIKDHLMAGARPEDIAVIAYTKDELKQIADLLTKENIPSMFAAPEYLLNNSRIRAILSFIRVTLDPASIKDAVIAANALVGGCIMDMPQQSIDEAVQSILEKAKAVNEAATLQLKKTLFMQFIDTIAFDDEAIEYFKGSLENKDFEEIVKYCNDFSLYGENASFKRIDEYPGVVLVTAHSSKGLEWPIVYNTISKYQKKTTVKKKDIEEIRRLLFVSATRARDELIITGKFTITGSTDKMPVYSMFLEDAFKAIGVPFAPAVDNL